MMWSKSWATPTRVRRPNWLGTTQDSFGASHTISGDAAVPTFGPFSFGKACACFQPTHGVSRQTLPRRAHERNYKMIGLPAGEGQFRLRSHVSIAGQVGPIGLKMVLAGMRLSGRLTPELLGVPADTHESFAPLLRCDVVRTSLHANDVAARGIGPDVLRGICRFWREGLLGRRRIWARRGPDSTRAIVAERRVQCLAVFQSMLERAW